jgi:hypothetical protein
LPPPAPAVAIFVTHGFSSTRQLFWPGFAQSSRQLGHRNSPVEALFHTIYCGIYEVFDYLRDRLLGEVLALSGHLSGRT